ncbi:alanine racemase [Conexibacter sp. CPCC 206217]|uniref:alanine racemase n=1 Tax=Conexibacter sp. CPCC 206217 TaxID=3064574 RepID=UPI00271AE00D|nr:alanine racemase [Conexibacter sp. CPCC 206217]MDO8213549.1 alanine racemase [Conexibacter sp. CPCC 206217]
MTELADTPRLQIDLGRLERNLSAMAQRTRDAGLGLRPHVKTHKMAEIGRRQLALGALGLTTAKLSEAEALADRGLTELFVCYPLIGAPKLARLRALTRRAHVMTIVDAEPMARALAEAMAGEPDPLDVLIKVDAGSHRVGVDEPSARTLAAAVATLPSLRLRGVCSHEGATYGVPDPEQRAAVARDEAQRLVAVAGALRADGHAVEIVSTGSTPGVAGTLSVPGLTEVRPGNYVFNDANQLALGVAPAARCALSVLTTVVSTPTPQRAIVDAGSKALTLDRGAHGTQTTTGFGVVAERPGITLVALSEEHGWLQVAEGEPIAVGEQLTIIPNHACPVVNAFAEADVQRDGRTVQRWTVDARGCMS